MSEVQTIIKDVVAITPYVWESASFFGVLGVLRVTQWIKNIRWVPAYICNGKHSKNGKFTYRKLKKKYLMGLATLGSFGIITLCLSFRYPDINQVMVIAAIAALSQFTIIEILFSQIDKKNAGMSEILSHGLYIPKEDHTTYTKIAQLVVGGGDDARREK